MAALLVGEEEWMMACDNRAAQLAAAQRDLERLQRLRAQEEERAKRAGPEAGVSELLQELLQVR